MKNIIKILYINLVLPVLMFADGFIIPGPGINIAVKYHHVTVTIQNQVATTEIDQVFVNDTDNNNLEAIYVFPIPEGATFSNFSMFVDGQELEAEVLNADSARAYYENIVMQNRDPALLEYVDRQTFRARIFPIAAHGEKRVTLSYDEVLDYDNGLIKYLYPLSTEKYSSKSLESVWIKIALSSPDPLKSIYSPTHTVTVNKQDDYHANINYAEEAVTPNTDFLLYYSVSSDDIGMSLLTYKELNEDGFYLLLAAPKVEQQNSDITKKRMIFVIDRSGSMSGEKIVQARDALKFCVNNLTDGDWFNIIDFDDQISAMNPSPVEAGSANIGNALTYINNINASGSTDINSALLRGLQDMAEDDLSNMLIFLTDGQPTAGVTGTDQILSNISEANQKNSRIFVFGVGYGVNTHLLDQLADQNGGTSVYVSPDENIEGAVSGFYQKISAPVLSDLILNFGGIGTEYPLPADLPDLFKGSQIVQLGKYLSTGQATIRLTGITQGETQIFTLDAQFPNEASEYDFIPRLWAVRRVGDLLNQIRLNGENDEWVDEVIALAKRYGIITSYTSYLITDDTMPTDNFEGLGDQIGAVAFDNAKNLGAWRNADNTVQTQSLAIRYVGNKTFFMRDSVWVDAQYDSTALSNQIQFGSAAYFEALQDVPELNGYLALGNNVQVNVNGINYEVLAKSADVPHSGIQPAVFYLSDNFPNPFNPLTTWHLMLHQPADLNVMIYNLAGQLVRNLTHGLKEEGNYDLRWNGLDETGIQMPSGVYILQVRAENTVQSQKITLMR